MESKVILELAKYEDLAKKSMELEQSKKEKADLEEANKKLKQLIFGLCEDEHNLKYHKLEDCLDCESYLGHGLTNTKLMLESGVITKKEIDQYITKRWNEEHKEHENDCE
ncbi:hypothetical protein DXD51_02835 [Eubacterium sp. TM05-53]|nr:hypothetical protein DXD51_02835 [Eubacterium sp. TM05-53]